MIKVINQRPWIQRLQVVLKRCDCAFTFFSTARGPCIENTAQKQPRLLPKESIITFGRGSRNDYSHRLFRKRHRGALTSRFEIDT